MQNFIDRTLFKSQGLSTQEMLRRLDLLSAQLHNSVESIKVTLDALVVSTSSSGKYTGTVYAVDQENNTVALQVEAGIVKQVAKV